jgi:hypothetical protein
MAPAAIANAGASLRSHEAFRAGQSLGNAAIDRGVEKVRDEVTVDGDTGEEFQVVDDKGHVIKTTTTDEWAEEGLAQADIMGTVRLVGGATIGIAVLVIVLNEVMSIESVQNSSGPFSGIIDSLETTGVAAISLLVVGLLVAAANRVMGFFGGGGF